MLGFPAVIRYIQEVIHAVDSKRVYKWSDQTFYGFYFWYMGDSDGVWTLRGHNDRYVPSSAAACFIVATSSGVSSHLGVETVMLVSWNMRKPKQVIP